MLSESAIFLMARRELKLWRRRRAVRFVVILLGALAWLPPLLPPLRSGTWGLASFADTVVPAAMLSAVLLPLLGLLIGADLLAGEIEDKTLVPVLTLPVSRAACFAGKCLGLGALLSVVYLVAFGSAGLAIALVHGLQGAQDYLAVVAGGLFLGVCCGGIGVLLGTSGRGRIHAFGRALVCWVVLVFLVDALLLSAIVMLAPAPPEAVGSHGHSELSLHEQAQDRSQDRGPGGLGEGSRSALPAWLMTLNPVDLFRLTALAAGPELRARLALGLPGDGNSIPWPPLALGWLAWLLVPSFLALRQFLRVSLL